MARLDKPNSIAEHSEKTRPFTESKGLRIAVLAVWALAVIFMLTQQGSISLDSIMAFSQENWLIIALVLLSLFALKGIVMMIYAGLLFAASGLLLPLPLAVAVNVLGVAVMVTIPFFLARFIGGDSAEAIRSKYPKVAALLQSR